jgi:hypothetical protein
MSKFQIDNPYEHLRIPVAKPTVVFKGRGLTRAERRKAEKELIKKELEDYLKEESEDYLKEESEDF